MPLAACENQAMGKGPKLVVVAHPRSGSNSLVEILDCHPELTLLVEPFNENFTTWLPGNPDYRAAVTDVTSLDRVVDGILADYSGFKVHSYQLASPPRGEPLRGGGHPRRAPRRAGHGAVLRGSVSRRSGHSTAASGVCVAAPWPDAVREPP